jgi:hypothetical protein
MSCKTFFGKKNFFERRSSGHTGYNDTGLEFLSCQGAEKKGGQTHRKNFIENFFILRRTQIKNN